MKKTLASLACSLLVFASYSQNDKSTHTITAEIKGLGNDTVYVSYYALDDETEADATHDTIIAHNDRLLYDLRVDRCMHIYLFPKKLASIRADGSIGFSSIVSIGLWLEPNKPLHITGQIEIENDNYLSYRVKGESISSDFANDRESYKTHQIERSRINAQINHYYLLGYEKHQSVIGSLFKERNKVGQVIEDIRLSYIKNNLDKDLSAFYLMKQEYDTLGVYYPQLAESVKKGMFEGSLVRELQTYEEYKLYRQAKEHVVEEGAAPDFTLLNLAGEPVALADLKGKYVVIDFWGSWCGPCMMGMPKMKQYYNKYKDKVKFVGIACNDKDAAWREAVEKNGLNWIQLKDDESGDATKKISARYGVGAFPTKFILDKDLKILGKFEGETEDFYEKLDSLLQLL